MAQTANLIETLKKLLKRQGKTYLDVAKCLDLSEASVKRLFSGRNMSLQRLDSVCSLLNIEISDLVREMQHDQQRLSELSHQQEQEIVSDLPLLLVTVLVLNHWTMQDIMRYFKFTQVECIRHLTRLDQLNIIELLPNNRIKLLVDTNFKWRQYGPIQQFFLQRIEKEYFKSRFQSETETLQVINGMLSKESNAVFQRKIQRLVAEFESMNKDDAGLPIAERFGTTVLLAMRDWDYEGLYGELRQQAQGLKPK